MLDLTEVALSALKHEAYEALRDLRYPRPQTSPEVEAVVRAASELASGGRPGSGGTGGAAGPLVSVFDVVGLEGRGVPGAAGRRSVFVPGEYGGGGPGSYFPHSSGEGYGELETPPETLIRQLAGLQDEQDVNAALNRLERYGSYVRSAGGGEDVSLFDGARATAAVAVCIAGHRNETGAGDLEDQETPRYLYVRGDLSGVQKFLYTITSKGALKMLRARSFFLELIAEHAVAELLRAADVPRTNVVYVGGGGFQLLLPNAEASRRSVGEVRGRLNAALAADFGRELYLALEAAPCGASDVTGAGLTETVGELARGISARKARRFEEELPDLLAATREPGLESCGVCTRDDAPVGRYDPRSYEPRRDAAVTEEEPVAMCPTCHMLARASRRFLVNRYLVPGGRDFRIGDAGYGLSDDPGRAGSAAGYALDGVGDDACLRGAVPLPAARYAARDEKQKDQIADFEQLARRSVGADLLAVLRMDVDDLGRIFGSGIPAEKRTFARYAALSRAFTTFFKLVLPGICVGRYERSLRLFGGSGERGATVVYSGGDDLFVVGAWSDVLELTVDVRRAFGEFVGHNPFVTLSGGVSLHKPGEPLYLMAEQAGAAEEEAKANKTRNERRKKDSAVLFYRGPETWKPKEREEPGDRKQKERKRKTEVSRALFWDEVEDGVVGVLEKINAFRPEKNGNKGDLPFPRGFTRLLLDVTDVYERSGHFSLPLLAYALARMRETAGLGGNTLWDELERQLLKIETIGRHLRPAATWLDLAERKEERREQEG